jgi:large subunit ribosomal protein L21
MTDETKKTGTTEESVVEDEPTTEEAVAEAAPAEEEVPEETASTSEETVESATEPEAEAFSPAAPAAEKKPRYNARKEALAKMAEKPGRYAVIETGGKQYRVKVGDRLTVEKIEVEAGNDITIDRVLMIGGDGSTRIGTPVVEGASVTATINDHGRGEKIVVFKYKAKKRYRRRTGHRQSQTYITITGISG